MAYKQSPGRQAMPRTGRGLSPTLMSGSPMKQDLGALGKREPRKLPKEPQKPKAPPKSESSKSGKNGPTDKFKTAKLRPVKNPPMKQTSDPEYTKTGYDKLKNIRKNLKDKDGRASIEKVNGVKIDPVTGKASATPYEKTYSAGKSGQQARVLTGDKKIAKSSSTKKGIDFGKKELRKEFLRDSTDTMNRRNRNANAINVSAGNKKKLTKADLDSMLNRKNVN